MSQSLNVLEYLPNEIIMDILQEWMDHQISISALDVAVCNRLLREKLYQCYRSIKSSLLNVNITITSKRLDKLTNWCDSRSIMLRSVRFQFVHEISIKNTPCFKRITELSILLEILVIGKLEFAWILDAFPFLTSLTIKFASKSIHPLFAQFIPMTEAHNIDIQYEKFQKEQYPLQSLVVERIDGYLPITKFEEFLHHCPSLHTVKFIDCAKLYIPYIQSIVKIIPKIKKIYFDGSWNSLPIESTQFHHLQQLYQSYVDKIDPSSLPPSSPTDRELFLDVVDDVNADHDMLVTVLECFTNTRKLALNNATQLQTQYLHRQLTLASPTNTVPTPTVWSSLLVLSLKECDPWGDDTFFTLLSHCVGKTLHTLSLNRMTSEFTNESMNTLARTFTALCALTLIECMEITDVGIAFLTSHPTFLAQLHTLNISDVNIMNTKSFGDCLVSGRQLRHVCFGNMFEDVMMKEVLATNPIAHQLLSIGIESHPQDETLIPWEEYTSLRSLTLYDCCLSRKEYQVILKLPTLHYLTLGILHAVDGILPITCFHRISYKQSQLKLLDLSRCQCILEDRMIENILSNCRMLETIRLKNKFLSPSIAQTMIPRVLKKSKSTNKPTVYYRMKELFLDHELEEPHTAGMLFGGDAALPDDWIIDDL